MPKAKTEKEQTTPKKSASKKTASPKSVELTPEGIALLQAFRNAKKAEAQAKLDKEQAELALREILGDKMEATMNGLVVLKKVNGKNTHFDRELMKEAYPEAYFATIRETLYDYLKTL